MKEDWIATIRGRAGFLVTPAFLLYATGGLAFAHVQTASAVAFTVTPDLYAGGYDETRVGYTVGGGGEWMIAPKWSIKAEYLFVDLGKQTVNLACLNTGICGCAAPGCARRKLRDRLPLPRAHRPRRPELSLRWPRGREVLISRVLPDLKPRHVAGAFCLS